MFKIRLVPLPIITLLVVIILGCSGGSSAVVPDEPQDTILNQSFTPPAETTYDSRTLLLAYDVVVDFENQEISMSPLRTAVNHFDIRPLLMNPWFCPAHNCVTLQFIEMDFQTGYFKLKATLVNPSTVVAHDVRGIVYDNDTHNHRIINADEYTSLWAPDGYDSIYPFKAYAKTDPERAIHALASFSEIYEFQFDPLPPKWAFPYAIDCSWPSNCEEPYEIVEQTQIGDFYSTHGCTQFTTVVNHHSGPAHLDHVTLDATPIGGEVMEMEYGLSDNTWRAMVINEDDYIEPGDYDLLITAYATGTDIALYDYFHVTVLPADVNELVSGTIYGSDTMEGIPLGLMTTSDGDELYTKETDFCGYFATSEVPPGSRVFSLAKAGYHTAHIPSTVLTEPLVLEEYLEPNTGVQPELPVIEINDPVIDLIDGSATISGTIQNMDCFTDQVGVYVHQGLEFLMDLDDYDGSFNQVIILSYGHNEIVVRGTNATGTVLSEKIEIDYYPDWNFRVTLTWDTVTDQDLHVWEPDLQHCYYVTDATTNLELDHDVISEGYGPENITPITDSPPEGVYPIGVNYYSGWSSGEPATTVTITLRLNVGTPDEEIVQFDHVLTISNNNGGYPVTETTESWYRPCDLVIDDTGLVTWQPADTSINLPN